MALGTGKLRTEPEDEEGGIWKTKAENGLLVDLWQLISMFYIIPPSAWQAQLKSILLMSPFKNLLSSLDNSTAEETLCVVILF